MNSPSIIDSFIRDEQIILEFERASCAIEIELFNDLYRLYISFLNSSNIVNSSIYYFSCSLCKTQMIKSACDLLRGHVNSSFSAVRVSLDAALYSLLLAEGRIDEAQYMSSDDKPRMAAISKLGKDIQRGSIDWSVLRFVHASRKLIHPFAHGGFDYFAGRIRMTPSGIEYSNFQNLDTETHTKRYFLDILWLSGGCLKAHLEISSRFLKDDNSEICQNLEVIKGKILALRELYARN